jgi:diguanylate cyclase (GGDEF)-like protein/PAS domain S-box-containing protein
MEHELSQLRKKVDKLTMSNELLEIMNSYSNEAIIVIEADTGVCLNINHQFTELFQYTDKDIIGQNAVDLVTEPEYIEKLMEMILIKSKDPSVAMFRKKDGSLCEAVVQGRRLIYNNRSVLVVNFRNLNDVVSLKDFYRKDSEFEAIFKNSTTGIMLLNENRDILRANSALAHILGYHSPDELCLKNVVDLHLNHKNHLEFKSFYETYLIDHIPVSIDYQLKHKKGHPVWVNLNGSLLVDSEEADLNARVIWIINDITSRKRTENMLQIAYTELETIFNNSLTGIVVLDGKRNIYKVNDTLVKMLDYRSRDELIGCSASNIHISKKEFEKIHEYITQDHIHEKNHEIVFRIRKKNGELIWVAGGYKPISTASPHDVSLGVVWVLRDITRQRQTEQELLNTYAEMNSLFNNSLTGIVLLKGEQSNEISQANQEFARMLGFSSVDETIGKPIHDYVYSGNQSMENQSSSIKKILQNEAIKTDLIMTNKDGKPFWTTVSCNAVDQNFPPDLSKGIICVFNDISDKKATEEKLKEKNRELERIFNNTMTGVFMTSRERIILKANHTFSEIMGYPSPEEMVNLDARLLHISEEAYEDFGEKYLSQLTDTSVTDIEFPLMKKNGSQIWVACSGKAIDSEDFSKGIIWSIQDITRRRNTEKRLIYLSRHDDLTGVYNRRYFLELSNMELLKQKRYSHYLSLMMLDIDHFKLINDTLGHAGGDQALKLITEICKDEIRSSDILGRIGGEEFAILLEQTPLNQAVEIAERIRKKIMNIPFSYEDNTVCMTVSIGVTQVDSNKKFDEAMKAADRLLYRSKHKGRNQVQFNAIQMQIFGNNNKP